MKDITCTLYYLKEELEYIKSLPKYKFEQYKSRIIEIKNEITFLEKFEHKISNYLFPDHIIDLYNENKDHIALSNHTCLFCYDDIKKGGLYRNFRPLIINKTTKDKYIVDHNTNAKVCEFCFDNIPNNISKLEEIIQIIELSSKNDFIEKKEKISKLLDLTDGFTLKKIKSNRV